MSDRLTRQSVATNAVCLALFGCGLGESMATETQLAAAKHIARIVVEHLDGYEQATAAPRAGGDHERQRVQCGFTWMDSYGAPSVCRAKLGHAERGEPMGQYHQDEYGHIKRAR